MNWTSDEDFTQLELLHAPLGEPGSGRTRYAAAMYFHRQDLLDDVTLESYRIACKEDERAAPHAEAAAVLALQALAFEIDVYLRQFSIAGVADVRQGLARWAVGTPHLPKPRTLPACNLVASATEHMSSSRLAAAIRVATPLLRWGAYDAYPLSEIGERFASGHAFATLVGEGGPFDARDYDLGLFVIGPSIYYRDHKHAAPELYAPLTGPHGWRFRPGDRLEWLPRDVPVWNEPFRPHATMTGQVPFLAIYGWTRDVNEIAQVIPCDDWAAIEQASAS